MVEPLLRVEGLTVSFDTEQRPVRALDTLSFELEAGKTLAIGGGSGAGKTLCALAIIGLLPEGAHASGKVWFAEENLLELGEERLRSIRGRGIALVFQEARTALDPFRRVGTQI